MDVIKSPDKDEHLMSGALLISRWALLIVVAITCVLGEFNQLYVLGLVLIVAAFTGLLSLPFAAKFKTLTKPATYILGDFLWIGALLFLTDGFYSPYALFIVAPIAASACWFDLYSTIILLVYTCAVTIAATLFAQQLIGPTSALQVCIYLTGVIIVGYLGNRLTWSQRRERAIARIAGDDAEAERNRLLSLINSMADAVIATDKNGKITHFNSAALDLLNTNAALTDKNIDQLMVFLGKDNKPLNLIKEASRQTTPLKHDDTHIINDNGESVSLYVSVSPIAAHFGHSKTEDGYIFLLRDVTKEKTLEEQRSEFIAVTSHELRTPLAIAEANISTALLPQSGKIDDAPRALLEQAHQSIIFLGKLVTDLTTLAVAERDSLETEVTVLEPKALINELAADYQQQAKDKGLKLRVDIADKLPVVVTSVSHVNEILQNFLTNALKYTHAGTITIQVAPSPTDPQNIMFSVTDTGIGISVSDQKHLFNKFYRSEDYRTRETGGTGLGLYITAKLAQRLNAKISFESKLNKGSTFSLEVPPYSHLRRDQRKVVNAQMDNIISSI